MKAQQIAKKNVFNEMYAAALEAYSNAYSPYSKVKVGAALMDERGLIFSGCNVENASYGATVCAERTAAFKGISEGSSRFVAVLVLTDSKDPWPPCGMCRQVLLEFTAPQTPVWLANTKGKKRRTTMRALCPESFGPKQMK